MNKGFTLIEVIIYIALFTIIMTGGFVAAYAIMDGGSNLNSKAVKQEEGNFVLRKINWALSNIDPIFPPTITGGSCSETITIYKVGFSPNPVSIRYNVTDKSIELRRGAGAWNAISTPNVKVSCLEFTDIPANSGAPEGFKTEVNIDGQVFTLTKYLRK